MKIELDTQTISKQEIKSLIQMLNTLLNEASYEPIQPMTNQSNDYGLFSDASAQQTPQNVNPSPSMFGMFDTPTTSSPVASEVSEGVVDEPNIFSLFAEDNSMSTTSPTRIEPLNNSETQAFNAKSVTQILEDAKNASSLNDSESSEAENVSKTADLVSKIFRQDYEKKEPKIITY